MSDAARIHPSLMEGDVLLADRAFCSFAHLALLFMQQIHGVFRMHQRTICDFNRQRPQRPRSRRRYRRNRPDSRRIRRLGHDDQIVAYRKPAQWPRWMSQEGTPSTQSLTFLIPTWPTLRQGCQPQTLATLGDFGNLGRHRLKTAFRLGNLGLTPSEVYF